MNIRKIFALVLTLALLCGALVALTVVSSAGETPTPVVHCNETFEGTPLTGMVGFAGGSVTNAGVYTAENGNKYYRWYTTSATKPSADGAANVRLWFAPDGTASVESKRKEFANYDYFTYDFDIATDSSWISYFHVVLVTGDNGSGNYTSGSNKNTFRLGFCCDDGKTLYGWSDYLDPWYKSSPTKTLGDIDDTFNWHHVTVIGTLATTETDPLAETAAADAANCKAMIYIDGIPYQTDFLPYATDASTWIKMLQINLRTSSKYGVDSSVIFDNVVAKLYPTDYAYADFAALVTDPTKTLDEVNYRNFTNATYDWPDDRNVDPYAPTVHCDEHFDSGKSVMVNVTAPSITEGAIKTTKNGTNKYYRWYAKSATQPGSNGTEFVKLWFSPDDTASVESERKEFANYAYMTYDFDIATESSWITNFSMDFITKNDSGTSCGGGDFRFGFFSDDGKTLYGWSEKSDPYYTNKPTVTLGATDEPYDWHHVTILGTLGALDSGAADPSECKAMVYVDGVPYQTNFLSFVGDGATWIEMLKVYLKTGSKYTGGAGSSVIFDNVVAQLYPNGGTYADFAALVADPTKTLDAANYRNFTTATYEWPEKAPCASVDGNSFDTFDKAYAYAIANSKTVIDLVDNATAKVAIKSEIVVNTNGYSLTVPGDSFAHTTTKDGNGYDVYTFADLDSIKVSFYSNPFKSADDPTNKYHFDMSFKPGDPIVYDTENDPQYLDNYVTWEDIPDNALNWIYYLHTLDHWVDAATGEPLPAVMPADASDIVAYPVYNVGPANMVWYSGTYKAPNYTDVGVTGAAVSVVTNYKTDLGTLLYYLNKGSFTMVDSYDLRGNTINVTVDSEFDVHGYTLSQSGNTNCFNVAAGKTLEVYSTQANGVIAGGVNKSAAVFTGTGAFGLNVHGPKLTIGCANLCDLSNANNADVTFANIAVEQTADVASIFAFGASAATVTLNGFRYFADGAKTPIVGSIGTGSVINVANAYGDISFTSSETDSAKIKGEVILGEGVLLESISSTIAAPCKLDDGMAIGRCSREYDSMTFGGIVASEADLVEVTWTYVDGTEAKAAETWINTDLDNTQNPVNTAGVKDKYTYAWTGGADKTEVAVSELSAKSNLTLYSDFNYNLYLLKADVDAGYVETVSIGTNVIECGDLVEIDGVEYYAFSFTGIDAKDAANSFVFHIVGKTAEDADLVTDKTVSIVTYAEKVLAIEAFADSHQLMIDMLNYINEACEFFNGGASDAIAEILEGKSVTAAPENFENVEVGAIATAFDGACFDLTGQPAYRFLLKGDYTGTLTFTVGGNSTTFNVENGLVDGNNYLTFEIGAHDLYKTVSISIDGVAAAYSLSNYINAMAANDVLDLAKAMFVYSKTADAFRATTLGEELN